MQIKSIIDPDNVSISESASGEDAIQKMQENYYHLILLDLLMPGIDGFGVLRFMKENKITTKVIVVTADIQDATKQEILSLGAFGFINKPPDKITLKNLINKVLEESEN